MTTVFPADCRCCGGPLMDAGMVPVCAGCVGRLRRSATAGCGRCGEPFDLDVEDVRLAAGVVCRVCRMAEPAFERAVAYGPYDDELREMVRLLKFGGVKGLAQMLGGRLGEAVLDLEEQAARELMVIAVPLFAVQERRRGFNQSVLLADEALRWLRRVRPSWKLTAAHAAMERRRSTEASFVLSRAGRRRNLRGAFAVIGDVRGKEVLLVDDIMTSGATARECARVLKAAGAAKVWVATVARAGRMFVRRQQADVAIWDLEATANADSFAARRNDNKGAETNATAKAKYGDSSLRSE